MAGRRAGRAVDASSGIDVGIGNGLDPAIGFGGGYAMATCEARDWVNSKLVLNVGSNFLESSLPTCACSSRRRKPAPAW